MNVTLVWMVGGGWGGVGIAYLVLLHEISWLVNFSVSEPAVERKLQS